MRGLGWRCRAESPSRPSTPPGAPRRRRGTTNNQTSGDRKNGDGHRRLRGSARTGRIGEAGQSEDRPTRNRVSVPAVRLDYRPNLRQGHPRRSLGKHRRARIPARLRRDGQSLPQPPRRVPRLRPPRQGARRHPGARDLLSAPLGQAGGTAVGARCSATAKSARIRARS